MHEFLHLDLTDWFLGVEAPSWGKLSRLLDQLPQHGRFKAALLDDDELAEQIYEPVDDDGPIPPMDFVGYDPVVAGLTNIGDILLMLRATLIAVNSDKGKMPPVKPLPRPESARERVERERSKERRSELLSILTPGR